MTKLFTFSWHKVRKLPKQQTKIKIKFIDETGKPRYLTKEYPEWIGVLANDIDVVVKKLKKCFKQCVVRYEKLDDRHYRELLPLFYDRIKNNDASSSIETFFYKVFINAKAQDVGDFLNSERVSYYAEEDWLLRIYLDFRCKFQSENFYYCWYEVLENSRDLMNSFVAVYADDNTLPPITVGSFDLETVPWEKGSTRFPTGHDVNDMIVMISLVLGNVARDGKIAVTKRYLFCLNPIPTDEKLLDEERENVQLRQFPSEIDLLKDFFRVLDDSRISVLTGYNVNNFDFPCLFARLTFSGCREELSDFSSVTIGTSLITTYKKKAIVDLYTYMLTFSRGGLTGFKLDDVAKVRLGETKVPVRATAIHKWYQARDILTVDLLKCTDLQRCYDAIQPGFSEHGFGTFRDCLIYCLVDSELVLKIMDKENVFSFLVTRANMSTMSVEEVLYYGNSRYIQNVFESYGTMLGYFVNLKKLRNVTEDGKHSFVEYANVTGNKKQYQGALNYCEPGFYQNVAAYDFESLYPSSIVYCNVSYETFAMIHSSSLANFTLVDDCCCAPFQVHDADDFLSRRDPGERFSFPPVQRDRDCLVMVWSKKVKGFLPTVIEHLIAERRREKLLMETDPSNRMYHKNKQLSFKLVMNSIYGCLGSNVGHLASFGLGASVCCIARNVLLGAYHYVLKAEATVPYCDTDSLFVADQHRDRMINDAINRYFSHDNINLQFEKFYPSLLVITKKKYCFETDDGHLQTKGFEVKSNHVTQTMVSTVLKRTYEALRSQGNESDGWILLVDLLKHAFFESRNAVTNCTTRKVRTLGEYSANCNMPHVRLMRRSQDRKIDDFINFTYVFTDFSKKENDKINPVFLEDVDEENHFVNFEKLFISQKKEILTLLNVGFFHFSSLQILSKEYEKLVQRIRWKRVVNAAILYKLKRGEDPIVLMVKSLSCAFKMVN